MSWSWGRSRRIMRALVLRIMRTWCRDIGRITGHSRRWQRHSSRRILSRTRKTRCLKARRFHRSPGTIFELTWTRISRTTLVPSRWWWTAATVVSPCRSLGTVNSSSITSCWTSTTTTMGISVGIAIVIAGITAVVFTVVSTMILSITRIARVNCIASVTWIA